MATIPKTAYHEAGHAILAAHLGTDGAVKRVDIHQIDGREGLTRANMPGRPTENMAVFLAGPLSAWIATGRKPGQSLAGASSDVCDRQELAEFMAEKPVSLRESQYYKPGLMLALRTIEQLWPAIEHIAARLATHKQVSGALVHAVVAEFTRHNQEKKNGKLFA